MTSEKYLGIPVDELAVSVFEGDDTVPRDEEAAELWKQCGVKPENIYYLPRSANWWGPAGLTGPCGPDTEMHIIRKPKCGPGCTPACDCGAFMEIWNDVFMQYNKTEEGTYEPLKQKNVDTGMGLERTLCIMTGAKTVYETDLFASAIEKLNELTGKTYLESEEITKAYRIVLDHTRTATFLLGDVKGIVPSNTDQGYVLRRLIRRAVRFGRNLGLPEGGLSSLSSAFVAKYSDIYPELKENEAKIYAELSAEEAKFSKTLEGGLKEFNKVITHIPGTVFPGKTAFRLYDTYGFPFEITKELAEEKGYTVDKEGYEKAFAEHQAKSHAGSEQKFACGLADHKEETTKLHTATHLLHAALKKVLGADVNQKGSNITEERLRFDFNFPRPMTAEEIKAVEDMVNEVIAANIPVVMKEMSVEEAKEQNFLGLFASKYGDVVKTYSIGDFSREICGGPHSEATGLLGTFKITKEQSSSAGIRRIKAVLK